MLPLLLGAIAGGLLLKGATDYPSEIKNLRNQMSKDEREDFMRDYKSLPNDTKTQFKQYLRDANLAEAGKLIGKDLSSYTTNAKNSKQQQNMAKAAGAAGMTDETAPVTEDAFTTRIKNILNAAQFDFDPQLVVEAAKQYENISGSTQLSFADKTRKMLDVSQ